MSLQNLLAPERLAIGVGEELFIAPLEWFASLQGHTNGVITGTHTFKEPWMGFMRWVLAPDKNSYKYTPQGDKGHMNLMHEISSFAPGSYPDLHALAARMLNKPLIALIKDSECGDDLHYQIGNNCFPGRMSSEFMTGTTKDGAKGYTFTPSSTFKRPLLYKGEVKPLGDEQNKLELYYDSVADQIFTFTMFSSIEQRAFILTYGTNNNLISTTFVNEEGNGYNRLTGAPGPALFRLWTSIYPGINILEIGPNNITQVSGKLPVGLETFSAPNNNIASFNVDFPAGLKNILLDGNNLTSDQVNEVLVKANALGLSNGNIVLTMSTPAPAYNMGLTALAALEARGYTVVVDEE